MLDRIPTAGPLHAISGWRRPAGRQSSGRASIPGWTRADGGRTGTGPGRRALLAAEAANAPARVHRPLRGVEPLAAGRRAYDAAYPVFLDRLRATGDNAAGAPIAPILRST